MASKHCTECGEEKPLDQFHRNHRMKDGHINQCKACRRPRNREWNRQNKEAFEAACKRYRIRHLGKAQARWAVGRALRDGKLHKPESCEGCGKQTPSRQLHGHHADYDKPLEVEWLCPECHGAKHAEEANLRG